MTEAEINSPSFNPGGLPHLSKPTDFKWSDIGGAALPAFDWTKGYDIEKELAAALGIPNFLLPVKDQNGSGSCGGQASSTEDAAIEGISSKSFEERSAKYIIAQTFVLDPVTGAMLGSRMIDNSAILKNQGVARESICPSYDNGNSPTDAFMNRLQDVTEAAREDAKVSRAKSYAFVFIDIDSFAQAISANHGMVVALNGQNNGTWFSAFPKAPVTREWGHFMYFGKAKLIDGKKYLGGLQSWGKNVGENGWQWFGEEWFKGGFQAGETFIFDDAVPAPAKYNFTRDLYLGKTGIDVKFLQIFLNTHGSPLTSAGPGSHGNETSSFGELTKTALIKFQLDHGIKPAAGYFGPITRAFIKAMP